MSLSAIAHCQCQCRLRRIKQARDVHRTVSVLTWVTMAESIRQPDELVLSGNIAENWRKFKQEFELYMLAAGYDEKPSKQKIALLLHVARKQAIEVYNTFAFSEEEEGEYQSVIGKFDAYCNPKKNETYEHYVFNSRMQLDGEAIEQFVTDLKLKAQTCQFDTLRDSMIRDRIVLGVWSQRVRERLLREDDLDLGKAVKICQAAEVTERQIETLSQKFSDGEANVHYNRGRHNPKHKPVPTTQWVQWYRRTRSTSLRPISPSVAVVTLHMRLVHVRLLINRAMHAVSRDISRACADRNRRCDTCHVTNRVVCWDGEGRPWHTWWKMVAKPACGG